MPVLSKRDFSLFGAFIKPQYNGKFNIFEIRKRKLEQKKLFRTAGDVYTSMFL